MHGVYKYECDGEIIYIGKTSGYLGNRINAHATEDKFAPYIKKAVVFFHETKSGAEADFLETALINQYQPVLNVAKKCVTVIGVQVKVDWVPWTSSAKPKGKQDVSDIDKIKGYSFTLHESTVNKLREAARIKDVTASKLLDNILSEIFA